MLERSGLRTHLQQISNFCSQVIEPSEFLGKSSCLSACSSHLRVVSAPKDDDALPSMLSITSQNPGNLNSLRWPPHRACQSCHGVFRIRRPASHHRPTLNDSICDKIVVSQRNIPCPIEPATVPVQRARRKGHSHHSCPSPQLHPRSLSRLPHPRHMPAVHHP